MDLNAALLIAKQFKTEIENTGLPVQAMYVFGSVAKRKARKGSDIDICVISSKFGKDLFAERVKLMGITARVNDAIEPHPFTVQDMKETYSPLVSEILKYGVKVV